MYKYLKQWPEDREPGWSEELQGVCHDYKNWFFTQNGNIWKFPLDHNLNDSCKEANKSKGIYKNKYGYILGDCDCWQDYLFVPVTGNGLPYIAVFRASDLSYVTSQRITRFGDNFSCLHWCAINPTDGRLFTSDRHMSNDVKSDTSPIIVYDIHLDRINAKRNDFLTYTTFILAYDYSGNRLTREYMQGGCFDDQNRLHITNGDYTLRGVIHNYANSKGGISVFSIPTISKTNPEKYYLIRRSGASDQSGTFCYEFDGTGEEPGGLTYWNFANRNVPGKLCGCLHVIMLDNTGVGDDDFFFKHYERSGTRDVYYNCPSNNKTKRGLIITTEKSEYSRYTTDEHRRRLKNQELMSGLFTNRNIDYMILENLKLSAVKKLISDFFSKADSNDWSYIYINCHGSSTGLALGYCVPRDYSETDISFNVLNNVISKISGKRIILIDSCHSGSATALTSANSFILSSAEPEDSAYGDSAIGNWATRYWACGAGYDFMPGAKDDMEADKNRDYRVTLRELYEYTNRKVKPIVWQPKCVMISNNPDEVIFE